MKNTQNTQLSNKFSCWMFVVGQWPCSAVMLILHSTWRQFSVPMTNTFSVAHQTATLTSGKWVGRSRGLMSCEVTWMKSLVSTGVVQTSADLLRWVMITLSGSGELITVTDRQREMAQSSLDAARDPLNTVVCCTAVILVQ